MTALRRCGAVVIDLSSIGRGVPDLLVYGDTGFVLMEIKSARGRLTADQEFFHARVPVTVVHTVQEALTAVGVNAGC